MARSWSKFGRKQEAAIAALLTQPTIERAARVAGIGSRTLSRWLRVPAFQEAYRRSRLEASSTTLALLQKGSPNAVAILHQAMADKNTPAAVRVRAADSFLNHAMKARKIDAADGRAAAAPGDTGVIPAIHIELGMARRAIDTAVPRSGDGPGVLTDTTAIELCRSEQDRLQAFLRDYCLVAVEGNEESWKREKCWVAVAELYPAYKAWALGAGDPHPIAKWSFEERLRQMGRERERVRPDGRRETKQVWVWLGIRFSAAGEDSRLPCDKESARVTNPGRPFCHTLSPALNPAGRDSADR